VFRAKVDAAVAALPPLSRETIQRVAYLFRTTTPVTA
jgi:hypothetical protein